MELLPTLATAGAAFGAALVYGSLFEYAFHRWVLHRHWRALPHPYRTHVLLHHRLFGGGPSYRVRRREEARAIRFQWWEAALLLAGHATGVWGLEAVLGRPGAWAGPAFGGAMAALAGYYALYEYLHWCMHNPSGRRIEATRLFRALDAHHRLHHEQWRVNFNVVVPLGDLLWGTRMPPAPGPHRSG